MRASGEELFRCNIRSASRSDGDSSGRVRRVEGGGRVGFIDGIEGGGGRKGGRKEREWKRKWGVAGTDRSWDGKEEASENTRPSIWRAAVSGRFAVLASMLLFSAASQDAFSGLPMPIPAGACRIHLHLHSLSNTAHSLQHIHVRISVCVCCTYRSLAQPGNSRAACPHATPATCGGPRRKPSGPV